jgi:tetrahydromethanopterin S-methyltransferase subunit F
MQHVTDSQQQIARNLGLAFGLLWQRTSGGEGLVFSRKLEAHLFSLGLLA